MSLLSSLEIVQKLVYKFETEFVVVSCATNFIEKSEKEWSQNGFVMFKKKKSTV